MVPAPPSTDAAALGRARMTPRKWPHRIHPVLLVLAGILIACLALVGGGPGHEASHQQSSSTGPLGASVSIPGPAGERQGTHSEMTVHHHAVGIIMALLVLLCFRQTLDRGLEAFWVKLARRRGPPAAAAPVAPVLQKSWHRAALGVYRL